MIATDYTLTTQTLAQSLLDFVGPLPEQLKMLNLIYTLWYKPADWNTLENKPAVIAAGATQAAARAVIDVPSTADLTLVATALAERVPAYTAAGKIKVSAGSAPFTPVEIDMMATAVANSIAQRTTTGALKIATGLNNDEAITLAQFNERVPAYTAASRVKVSNGSSPFTPTEVVVAAANTASAIAQRGADNTIKASTVMTDRTNLLTVGSSQSSRLFKQPAHTAKSAAATLTAAELLSEVIVGDTTSAAFSLTLPTAANLDTALAAIYGTLAVDDAIKFKIININGASNAITLVTNTGWTLIGSTNIGAWFYREFIARRTGAAAYTLYMA